MTAAPLVLKLGGELLESLPIDSAFRPWRPRLRPRGRSSWTCDFGAEYVKINVAYRT